MGYVKEQLCNSSELTMLVAFITNHDISFCLEMPCLPRVGETLAFLDMPEVYHEENGDSPMWVVYKIEHYIENAVDCAGADFHHYIETRVYIKNEEDE